MVVVRLKVLVELISGTRVSRIYTEICTDRRLLWLTVADAHLRFSILYLFKLTRRHQQSSIIHRLHLQPFLVRTTCLPSTAINYNRFLTEQLVCGDTFMEK